MGLSLGTKFVRVRPGREISKAKSNCFGVGFFAGNLSILRAFEELIALISPVCGQRLWTTKNCLVSRG